MFPWWVCCRFFEGFVSAVNDFPFPVPFPSGGDLTSAFLGFSFGAALLSTAGVFTFGIVVVFFRLLHGESHQEIALSHQSHVYDAELFWTCEKGIPQAYVDSAVVDEECYSTPSSPLKRNLASLISNSRSTLLERSIEKWSRNLWYDPVQNYEKPSVIPHVHVEQYRCACISQHNPEPWEPLSNG